MSRDSNRVRLLGLVAVLLLAAVAWPGLAQTETGYRLPAKVLVDLVDRPPTPQVRLSGDSRWLLLLEQASLPSIAELSEPELRLGGLRFKPDNYGPSRRATLIGMTLRNVASGESREVRDLPESPRLDHFAFSPDSRHVAFTQTFRDRIELWVADVETAQARRLLDWPLNLNARLSPQWLSDSKTIVAAFRVEDASEPPARPTVPTGPVIQENLGTKAPNRTYQDLLKSPYDETVFSHYLTAQLAAVSLDGSFVPLGEPGLVSGYSPSPDGRYLLVETLHKPFSYLVPARRFPTRVEVVDLAGGTRRLLFDLPLHENVPVPFGSVPTGPRSFEWRADADATLVWAEALDGGDAGREAELRDELFFLAAPFTGKPTPWTKLQLRYGGVDWASGELALVNEWWWKTRRVRTSRAAPDHPESPAKLLADRSFEDRYSDPGDPVTLTDARGQRRLRTADGGKTIYRIGSGASPEGDRPFLDACDLESGDCARLFHSAAPYFERPLLFLDGEGRTYLTSRESVEEPPNFFVRDLKDPEALRQLTYFPHPSPELQGIQKELIKYQRDDGVELTATLYLPSGYDAAKDGPLPTLVWAYPREFKDADAAGQVRDSPYRFDRVGWWSPLLWLTQGYAVLDDPAMPIVGEGDEEPNDTFREQLVASAKAAVDECIRRGVGEAGRFAIGGHSYGAFMTANLLAHSDLFAAGIARSGAYNRTLTPFGFQSEERTLWEAPDVYFKMSPFMHAEKINEPILLIHGDADNNSGTFPMQSERFYNALKGHGATARLVMLPYESHGYRARESVLHMLWETGEWLDRYVKNVPEVEASEDPRGSL